MGVLSGRRSSAVERRAQELKFAEIHQGVVDKVRTFDAILGRHQLEAAQIAYLGDDLVDVPVLRRAGFAATVPEAPAEVREHVHLVTERAGGGGAVREVLEFILRAQGRWEAIVSKYEVGGSG
jgi:3-deoxy-D-manno-octulosonate 8-phosphate phosphatase (KDO 8-P phosphatase)